MLNSDPREAVPFLSCRCLSRVNCYYIRGLFLARFLCAQSVFQALFFVFPAKYLPSLFYYRVFIRHVFVVVVGIVVPIYSSFRANIIPPADNSFSASGLALCAFLRERDFEYPPCIFSSSLFPSMMTPRPFCLSGAFLATVQEEEEEEKKTSST